ncbi:hypothetical protein AYI68_g6265 [Smittium mucronatum]|uniref:Uncharacterized protein n=1 Tax=Smittium mucronatum TaxID=133383 RepID=A0A1R0GRY2_9FUNG|nr:hypothetical protein AYI68_g6265 [Smittium mucronatum]
MLPLLTQLTCHPTFIRSLAEGILSKDPRKFPGRRTAHYVQFCMVQTDRQPIGSEKSVKGIQNPFQEHRISEFETIIGKNGS